MNNLLASFIREWITPKSDDRDIAFRERSIRTMILIVLSVTVLSFSVSAFSDEWKLFSIPTLHVSLIIAFIIAAEIIRRGHVTPSGLWLVFVFLFASASLTVLTRESGSIERFLTIIPAFMFAITVASVLVPTRFIVVIAFTAIVLFSVSQYLIPVSHDRSTPTDPIQLIGLSATLMLLSGVTLLRLRVEFDARLEGLQLSIQEAITARKRAEEADRTKSQFLANMSHELRTPLNAIIGYDEAMLAGMAGEFTPQQTKLLGHIQHNSRRLLNLINDILDLSKIESGSMEVYVSPMSPKVTISNAVDSLRSLAIQKDITLMVSFSDDFPEVIMGDSRKIEQVLVNLLSNAIKFTESGGITVQAQSINETHWEIQVRDTGIGMSSDALKVIFDPFTQVDGTTTRKYKGTGLGLSITKQLVEMMEGTIEVESTVDMGTTFTLSLPRLKLPQTDHLTDARPKIEIAH